MLLLFVNDFTDSLLICFSIFGSFSLALPQSSFPMAFGFGFSTGTRGFSSPPSCLSIGREVFALSWDVEGKDVGGGSTSLEDDATGGGLVSPPCLGRGVITRAQYICRKISP